MDNIRKRMQSFLQINPPTAMMINLVELFDFQGNAIKNRIWYRGEPAELEQLYWQIPKHGLSTMYQMFWASHQTAGMEMRKIHTGLPSTIVNLLSGIVASNLNDLTFEGSQPVAEAWEHIAEENGFKKLLEKCVAETLVVGDGAYKISIDPKLSEYPIIEFWAGDRRLG